MYEIIGWNIGPFVNAQGQLFQVRNLFLKETAEMKKRDGHNIYGCKVSVEKLAADDVISGFAVGDIVTVHFNKYGKVDLIQPMY